MAEKNDIKLLYSITTYLQMSMKTFCLFFLTSSLICLLGIPNKIISNVKFYVAAASSHPALFIE